MVRIHSPRPNPSNRFNYLDRACRNVDLGLMGGMPRSMPSLNLARPLHRGTHGVRLGVNIALRRGEIAMSGQIRQCIRVHDLCPTCKAGMAQAIEFESIHSANLAGPLMLFPEGRLFNVATSGVCRKNPFTLHHGLPHLQHGGKAWGHWNHSPRLLRFSVEYMQRSIADVRPTKAVTLLGPESAIVQDDGHMVQALWLLMMLHCT